MEPFTSHAARLDAGRVASSLGSSDVEPARAFLQDRIKLWAFWVFALSSGFYLINILTMVLLMPPGSPGVMDMLRQPNHLDHLAATVTFGGLWLLMHRAVPSLGALRALELAALFVGCALFTLMCAYDASKYGTGLEAGIGLYSGVLACASVVMARAIAVPSTPRRTLIGSVIAMSPLVLATMIAAPNAPPLLVNVAAWCAVSIAIAAVGSRIIFGLRVEAAQARKLGQYTLEEKIGAGGMGAVYRASHAMLRRPTAIKLLPPDRAGEANLLRFEREVQMTSELSHPNTVAIYDYGRTPDGVFYYAMEYLDGINLEDLVRAHGPQPAGRVIAILDQVCGALSEAHGRGLVHRDIKPANIILTERGGEPDVAKVVDFGLVKPFASEGGTGGMSMAGVLTGTPHYMSPESMTMPETADPRGDLYALGAVGYFLVTGKPVFDGATVVDVLGHHLHAEPIPPSRRTDAPIPPDLDAVLLQCLRKRPEERPASAAALREMLRRVTGAAPWTSDLAAAWWQTFRSNPARVAPAAGVVSPELAVTVDLEHRLTGPMDGPSSAASLASARTGRSL